MPVIKFDADHFKKHFPKLCKLHCTVEEFCDFFEINKTTLDYWVKNTYDTTFTNVFKQKSGKGKLSLRRKQYLTALKGNTTMLIWLGKNWLGQSDSPQLSIDDRKNFNLAYRLDDL